MQLDELLHEVTALDVVGRRDIDVSFVAFDSRKVTPGSMYVAVAGTQVDGHAYVDVALAAGATVILCERRPSHVSPHATYVIVPNSGHALGIVASNFYGRPSSQLVLVGITGTNGKTTTVTLLHQISQMLGHKSGLFSTIKNLIGTEVIPSTHTTPDPVQLNSLMRTMIEHGCKRCFMEVSSHALVQKRTVGLEYAGGIFSNITPEHLDYHKTFDAYFGAKKEFFDALSDSAFALTNLDDPNGRRIVAGCRARTWTYSIRSGADYSGELVADSYDGITLRTAGHDVSMRLAGAFNAYNALAVYATLVLLGDPESAVRDCLVRVDPVKGRFNRYLSPTGVRGVVDFAHTPDALQQILSSLHAVAGGARILTIIGCGGDRDREKRPKMARIAYDSSDVVILTSDNPRTEDPMAIIDEMLFGIAESDLKNVHVIPNRDEAIQTAASLARKGDVVLVAGKGHETYQEIQGSKYPFDDFEKLQAALGTSNA